MGFESVRGYVHLASGLTEVTKARATEAAQGLLSLPAAGIATGNKVAVQAGALAEEMLAVATTNHSSLAALVRSEVDVAVTRLGLVPAEKLEEAQAEATRLRTEVARLRSASSSAAAARSTTRKAAPKRASTGASAGNGAARSTAITGTAKTARTAKTTTRATTTATRARRSAVTTRATPAGT